MTERSSPPVAHPRRGLTALRVKTERRPGRHGDGDCLYLNVKPSGAKSWVLRIVVQGKSRDIGLGSVSLVSLVEAREEAQRLRKMARQGDDPLAERKRPSMPTFTDAARQYYESIAPTFKKLKGGRQWWASLGSFRDAYGTKRVDAVTTADVLEALGPRWLSHVETSKRLLRRLRVIFEWCAAHGYRAGDNPTNGVTKVLPKQSRAVQHRPALPYREVPTFLRAVPQSNASVIVQLALEFLVLSCTRTKELLGARWEEIDVSTQTWTVPAIRMKYGGLPHRVPLSSRCLAILEQAQALTTGSPYIFPNPRSKKPFSDMVFTKAIGRMAARKAFVPSQPYVPHGFRSSFRDWAEELELPVAHEVKEAVLAHKTENKTEAAYLRTDLFEKRRSVMETWARFCAATPAKVIAFRA